MPAEKTRLGISVWSVARWMKLTGQKSATAALTTEDLLAAKMGLGAAGRVAEQDDGVGR